MVDSVCPYCSSMIDEPVIHKLKRDYQSRLTSITGAFLLIVAGVTPAVVSARESIETGTIMAETVVVSTTSSTPPVTDSTSTTLDNSIETNPTNNAKTPTIQKPKEKKPSPSGTVYVAPLVTTTNPPVPSCAKGWVGTWLWRPADKRYAIEVDTCKDGSSGEMFVTVTWPEAIRIDSTCSASSAPIYQYESFKSIDGGTSVEPDYKNQIPSKRLSCSISGMVTDWYEYRENKWFDYNQNVVASPVSSYWKFKLTNLRSGEVVESPWVLIDWSTIT